MVATPRPDQLPDQIKGIKRQLDVLSRSKFVQYQPIPLLTAAVNNDYSNSTTTPKLLVLGGYTFTAGVPVIHLGYYVIFAATGVAAGQIQLNATDSVTLATTTLLVTSGSSPGASVLTSPGTSTVTSFVDVPYTVPANWFGHTVMLAVYSTLLSGTGTLSAYPIYAREAAS